MRSQSHTCDPIWLSSVSEQSSAVDEVLRVDSGDRGATEDLLLKAIHHIYGLHPVLSIRNPVLELDEGK